MSAGFVEAAGIGKGTSSYWVQGSHRFRFGKDLKKKGGV